jgi:hypothetical protein
MKEIAVVKSVLRPIIKNADSVVCKKCVYFRELKNQNAMFGKCTKFGEKNIITGVIQYRYANDIRNDSDLCGKRGLYYVEK